MWLQIYIKTMFRPAGLAFSKQYFINFNDINEAHFSPLLIPWTNDYWNENIAYS